MQLFGDAHVLAGQVSRPNPDEFDEIWSGKVGSISIELGTTSTECGTDSANLEANTTDSGGLRQYEGWI